MVFKRGSVALALVVAVGALAGGWGGSTADAATLDTLLSGESFTVGNATYSNFTYGGVDASTVTVTASTSGNVSSITFGRTSGTWNVDSDSSVPNYTVTFAAPVTSLGLSFVGTGTPTSVAGVTEDARDPITGYDYTQPNLWVYTGMIGTLTNESYTFSSPVSSLNIVKSIDIAADPGDTGTTITTVTNSYSSSVPEPASLSLLGVGAMVLIRRRRRKA